MVLGTGIDVVTVEDVRRELARGAWTAADGIFRDSELRYCNAVRSPARRLAARFAAKEAVLKALGVGVTDLEMLREVEVIGIAPGHVKVSLHGRAQRQSSALGVQRVLAALHADRNLAAAMVILEG
jgi:holo-[acyl-carrier protein] synthase